MWRARVAAAGVTRSVTRASLEKTAFSHTVTREDAIQSQSRIVTVRGHSGGSERRTTDTELFIPGVEFRGGWLTEAARFVTQRQMSLKQVSGAIT